MSKPKRPTAPCPYCGRVLSRASLRRHAGTQECTNKYWARKLQPGLARPQGWVDVEAGAYALLPLFRRANLPPDIAPIQKRVVWDEGAIEPRYATLAPLWVAVAGKVGAPLKEAAIRTDRAGATTAAEKAVGAAWDVFQCDMLVLLKHMKEHPDEALGLGVALELAAKHKVTYYGNVYDEWDLVRAKEILEEAAKQSREQPVLASQGE